MGDSELIDPLASSSDLVASVPDQHLLGNCGDVNPVSAEDMTEGESAPADKMMTGEVVQMPPIRSQLSVKPDRVIEAGTEE